jgi:hypothetical protein
MFAGVMGTVMEVERVHQGVSAFCGVALFAEDPCDCECGCF